MNYDHLFDGAPETRRGRETRERAIIALQWLIEEQITKIGRASCRERV